MSQPSSVMPGSSMRSASPQRGMLRRAFTLIELLVVIAIISILVALLFPVFATARESARQSLTITHLQEIQNGLALYKLDNKAYPPVLFAYTSCSGTNPCVASVPMGSAVQNTGVTYTGGPSYLSGLYPTYVKDWHDFTCPDNFVDDPTLATKVNVNTLGQTTVVGAPPPATGQLGQSQFAFYEMDAMDVSPEIDQTGQNQLIGGNNPANWRWLPRYQTSWDSYHPWLPSSMCPTPASSVGCALPSDPASYLRQLHWTNPPPNTYVTSLTYHIPNGNVVLVLYESGTVAKTRSYGPGVATNSYDDNVTDVSMLDANSDSTGNFWKFKSNQ